MKQAITIDQLNELSEKGKTALLDWFDDKWNDDMEDFHFELLPINDRRSLRYPALSIGQMIEFLDEHVPELEVSGGRMTKSFLVNVPDNAMIWEVLGPWSTIEHEPVLCDALFEAVKEILERD